MATINAPATPEASKKKWNNKIFNEIGANNIKENATHLLNNNNDPIRISNNATVFNKYPVAANEDMNAAALWGSSGKGINGCGSKIFNPNNRRIQPSTLLTILVNMEFISGWFKD